MRIILILVVAVGLSLFVSTKKKKSSTMTFDDFVSESKEIALRHKKQKERITESRSVGIKCRISSDDENVTSVMEMYSIDDHQQWTKSTITHQQAISMFSDDSATQEQIRKVRTNPLKFDI